MKTEQAIKRKLSFRPFRRVEGKLVVTSYMGWRKIYTSNYGGAIVKLLPFPKIKKGETVYAIGNPSGKYNYWHPTKFEPLFWHVNGKIRHSNWKESIALLEAGLPHPYSYPIQDDEVFSMFDCDGCPAFSHKTAIYISENYPNKMHLFEPLTADIVYEYFEIMRDSLKNIQWYNTQPPKS